MDNTWGKAGNNSPENSFKKTLNSYPLEITGKILAIAPQLYVRDSNGQLLLYVKQKLLAFRERVNVFRDEAMQNEALTIAADRILDFSANYRITDAAGQTVGNLRRKGMRSFWKAAYEITRGDAVVANIHERNPWIKVIDSLIGNVPILGMLSGLFFNPSYSLEDAGGTEVLRISKRVSLLERKFLISAPDSSTVSADDEQLFIASILMMVLLEGDRG